MTLLWTDQLDSGSTLHAKYWTKLTRCIQKYDFIPDWVFVPHWSHTNSQMNFFELAVNSRNGIWTRANLDCTYAQFLLHPQPVWNVRYIDNENHTDVGHNKVPDINYKSLQVAVDQIQLCPVCGPLVPNSSCTHTMLYISLYDFNVNRHFMTARVLFQSWKVQYACEMQTPTNHWY